MKSNNPSKAQLFQRGLLFSTVIIVACALPPAKGQLPTAGELRPSQKGIASWYGPDFHGKATASGVIYNQFDMTAAHQTLPLGSRVMVTNMDNGRSTEVLINDRGPFAKGRIIDLSYAAAQSIDIVGPGTAMVRVEVMDSPVPLKAVRPSLDYTLQLGSFAQLENAQRLRDQLANAFGDATITPVQSRDTTYYRVQVGQFSNRAGAEDFARQLSQAGYTVIVMER
jgi:rare lipoprotein A